MALTGLRRPAPHHVCVALTEDPRGPPAVPHPSQALRATRRVSAIHMVCQYSYMSLEIFMILTF